MKYLIYARVSERGSDYEGETSIQMQLEICRRFVKEHGGIITAERADEFFSGKDTRRPEFSKIMQELDSGEGDWDTLIVYKLSRMTRSLKDGAEIFEKLFRRGRGFVSATENLDFSSPSGRAMLGMMQVFNQFEREQSIENTRNKMMQIASRGEWPSGRTPFGYKRGGHKDNTLYIDERKASVVRDIFEMYSSVDSADRTRRILSKYKGILTPSNLYVILRNRNYLGELWYNGKSFPGKHEPIISRELFDRVQKMLPEKNGTIRPKAQQYNYLLSGIIYHCAYRMNSLSAKSGDYHYYVCPKCKKRVPADQLEKQVLNFINTLKIPKTFFENAMTRLKKEDQMEKEKRFPELDMINKAISSCEEERKALFDTLIAARGQLSPELIERINQQDRNLENELVRLNANKEKLVTKFESEIDYRNIALEMLNKLRNVKEIRSNPVSVRQAILANIQKIELADNDEVVIYPSSNNETEWHPLRDSNPCYQDENLVSWASRRKGLAVSSKWHPLRDSNPCYQDENLVS